MRTTMLPILLACALSSTEASNAFGQLTVQQPVIQSIGGQFAVSVPDRGGIHLGSISRAGESRNSYGFPFTRGSSVGRFTTHSSMSAHVWIHDLREMDRMILDMAESAPTSSRSSTSSEARRAGLAWTSFQPRRGVSVADGWSTSRRTFQSGRTATGMTSVAGRSRTSPVAYGRVNSTRTSKSTASTTRRNRALDPARNFRLGVEAEESGKLTLAKLHYEVAAQYGSKEGARRLQELASKPIASK